MSDELQFVVCGETRFHRSIEKLKFVDVTRDIAGAKPGT
jgi:hypothetical protein